MAPACSATGQISKPSGVREEEALGGGEVGAGKVNVNAIPLSVLEFTKGRSERSTPSAT